MSSRTESYETRGKGIAESRAVLERKSIALSAIRLVLFLLSAVLLIVGIVRSSNTCCISSAAVFIVFVLFCVIHSKIQDNLRYLNELYTVNSQYILRMNGDFDGLYSCAIGKASKPEERSFNTALFEGTEFYTADHDYCQDLGIFGKRSLFSLISVCETVMGRRRLADKLLQVPSQDLSAAKLLEIQKGCGEMISDIDSLQEFQALARLGTLKISDDDVRGMFSEYDGRKASFRPVCIILPLLWFIPAVAVFAAPGNTGRPN